MSTWFKTEPSDRVIAAQLTIHGDDKGLCLMPTVAPIQCVVVPIIYKEKEATVKKAVEAAVKGLAGMRIYVDWSENTPGNKFYHWEMKGVPLRLEIGPRDAEAKTAVLARRDTGEKKTVQLKDLRKEVSYALDAVSEGLKKEAAAEMKAWMTEASSMDEAKKALKEKGGIIRASWCAEKACGLEIEEALNATLLGTNEEKPKGSCVNCKKEGRSVLLISRSY